MFKKLAFKLLNFVPFIILTLNWHIICVLYFREHDKLPLLIKKQKSQSIYKSLTLFTSTSVPSFRTYTFSSSYTLTTILTTLFITPNWKVFSMNWTTNISITFIVIYIRRVCTKRLTLLLTDIFTILFFSHDLFLMCIRRFPPLLLFKLLV